MALREIEFSPALAEALARWRTLGVVVEVCLFEFDADADEYALGRETARAAIEAISARYASPYYRITVDENIAPVGELIDAREFLGPGFDFANRRVAYFEYRDGGRSSSDGAGFVRALLDPPYGVRLMPRGARFSSEYGIEEQRLMTGLLLEFLDRVFGVDPAGLDRFTIRRWSDDWSNFFDAGREWWGTFFWTFLDPPARTITVLAASTTD